MPLLNDQYDVETRLYEGARFEILRARRRVDDLPVILKLLKNAKPSPAQIARLKREAETVRSVDSPFVVRCYGFETDQKRWALVQEDFGGVPIATMIGEAKYELKAKLEVAISLVRGISDLHSRSVIHKDINPTNVLWNAASGALKLIDFGISTVLSQENPDFFTPNRLEGTLAYISPEQTGRTNAPVDYRTDFYSLGVTLYELFTGARPFTSEDPLELVHAHIARRPASPHETYPELPAALGAVIMKLLEKSPKARYQSAYGILSDLQRCRDELTEAGEIPAFPLAAEDISERFIFPRKLYGREHDVEQLVAALNRSVEAGASDGEDDTPSAATLVLVTGNAGMGKSALVRELHRPITEQRGYFIMGKFEQFHREPYFAIVAAFRSLIGELLRESEDRLEAWRERLTDALGPNGRVITDVIPQVELIIGPQPELVELGPNEQLNRFNQVFRNFIHALARPEHPVTAFIDDLQWADAASLELLKQLLGDDRPHSLLVVGAYRASEVDANHPLTATLSQIRSEEAAPVEISVAPLEVAHVAQLIADTVATTVESATPLAELVTRNTEGNPLFIKEYLQALHEEGLLRFERSSGLWQWDLGQIEGRGTTESVLDLTVEKLKRLGQETQRALTTAAVIGNRFRLDELASLSGTPLEETFETLLPALRAGVVVTTSEAAALTAAGDTEGGDCRFFHDRVQQAAYSLLDESERADLHLRIGRMLLGSASGDERGEEIFEIVDQLNQARELITGPEELIELAELNLEAGHKAASSGAYAAAGEFLEVARAAATPGGWQTHYELTMAIHRELAVAQHLVGDHDRSDELTGAALEHARTKLEKAEILVTVVRLFTTAARYAEALEAMNRGLKLLGHELPPGDVQEAMGAAFGVVQEKLGDATPASLVDRPTMSDPEIRAATRLLIAGMAAAFYVDPFTYSLIIFCAMALALEHGHPPEGVAVYAWYGHLLSALFGQPQAGYEFAKLGLELSERRRSLQDKCLSCFVLANWTWSWVKHLHETAPISEAGFRAGMESGELMFAGYVLYYGDHNKYFCGAPLDELAEDLHHHLAVNHQLKNHIATDGGDSLRLVIGNLRGETSGPMDFATEDLEEAALLARCEGNQSVMVICYYYIFKTMVLGLYREFDEALEASAAAEPLLQAVVGNVATVRHPFHTALALCGKMESASEAERPELMEKVAGTRDQLAQWAEGCPENYAHLHALLAAELARLDGDAEEAAVQYQRAIEQAAANDYPQDRALANELAGRFQLGQDEADLAAGFLSEAHHGYLLWGARHKVQLLEAEFTMLAATAWSPTERTIETTRTASLNTSTELDLASVMRASQAISGEIRLDRLLERLMALVIENAGADRGVLVVCSDDDLLVEANGALETRDGAQHLAIDVQQGTPLASYDGIPGSVVRYAVRTNEDVILGDASQEGSFTRDSYIQRERPNSVACLPMNNQGQLMGVLYLENQQATHAFTENRVELLRMLSGQFAISIENARLYREMEQKVEQRTEQLRDKNQELQETLDNLRATQSRLIHSEKMASLGQLTAGVAHEINNPLNFVNNFASLGVQLIEEIEEIRDEETDAKLEDVADIVEDLRLNVEAIHKHGERASGIVKSMLEHARGTVSERELTNLNTLVERFSKLAGFGRSNPDARAPVAIDLQLDDCVGEIQMVPQEIGRVLVNLLNNAFDAVTERAQDAGEPFDGLVKVQTRCLDGEVEIRVTDNGTGIPEEIRSKIFEPFYTTKSGQEGTGLGLSLCYDVVVQGHNGDLRVESEPGQGAAFILRLPTA